MGTFYYMNQKHVVPEMCAVVFVRDRKRHAIASLNTGSLCCSEWILPNRTTESCAYISRSVYSYLRCWCLRWGIWVSGRSDQSFCAKHRKIFSRDPPTFPSRDRMVPNHPLSLYSPPGTYSTMAQTGVSGPVVVDGESFLDALFASAGQGWGTRQHRLQVEGRSRRWIDWRHPG